MRWPIVLFAFLAVVGCSRTDEKARLKLEQQKLTLEKLERQQANLVAMSEKEKELRDLEKTNQKTLQELEKHREELREFEEQQKARLQEIEERGDAVYKMLHKQEQTLQDLREENAALEAKAELARFRQPYLQKLVLHGASHLETYGRLPFADEAPGYDTGGRYEAWKVRVANYWRTECFRALRASNVELIPSNEEFEARAVEALETFVKSNCKHRRDGDRYKYWPALESQ